MYVFDKRDCIEKQKHFESYGGIDHNYWPQAAIVPKHDGAFFMRSPSQTAWLRGEATSQRLACL